MTILKKEEKKPRAVKMGDTLWSDLGEVASKKYNLSRGEIIRLLIKEFLEKESNKKDNHPGQASLIK